MFDKNAVAKNPPMGWNSYDYYDTTVTEPDIRANAEYMASHLKPFGYEYIVVDIQWSDPNAGQNRPKEQYISFSCICLDEYSRQIPAENRFPSAKNGTGFRPLADYIHSLGLKFGIHIMRGIPRYAAHTHMKLKGTDVTANQIANPFSISKWNGDMYGVLHDRPGAQEYYNSLFELYAQWCVDFVKVDDICNTNMYEKNPYSAEKEIEMIHQAIAACGRPMVFSLSPGPAVIEKAWHMEKYANMWRITDDFWDDWRLLKAMFERCEVWQKHVSEGCYPDCDMLPVGRLGKGFKNERSTNFTWDEQKTMLTLWCMFRSPLMIGADLPQMDKATLELLTNRDVLYMATNCHGARQVSRDREHAVWICQDDNSRNSFIALFNLSDQEKGIEASLKDIGAPAKFVLEDLWEHRAVDPLQNSVVSSRNGRISAPVPPHGVALYRMKE